jgi:hypothetical protein
MKKSRTPISERFQKALRLGVRFNGTHFELLNGTPLPELSPGAIGELVIAPQYLVNGMDRLNLVREIRLPLLAKDTEIYLGMSVTAIPGALPKGLVSPRELQVPSTYLLTKVILLQDLFLCLRGDQKAWLDECECMVEALSLPARSLNHAFTLASTRFEIGRRQHNANVFLRAWTKLGERWQRLDELRITAIEAHIASQLEKSATSGKMS